MVFDTYYNYRRIEQLDVIQDLYPGWRVGTIQELDDTVARQDRFIIGQQISRCRCNPSAPLGLSLDGHLLIELIAAHWFAYEAPVDKFHRGPYSLADNEFLSREYGARWPDLISPILAGRVAGGKDSWYDPVSFLPVKLWVYGRSHLSHFIEATPYEATHVLYCYDEGDLAGNLNVLSTTNPFNGNFFRPEMLACYSCRGIGASFVLAELSLPGKGYDSTDPFAVTRFRRNMTWVEMAYQRYAGPTCPSTTAMRFRGALEHGVIPDDLREILDYL